MAVITNLRHLIYRSRPDPEQFKSKGGGGRSKEPTPVANREQHAQLLLAQLNAIEQAAAIAGQRNDLPESQRGIYVEVVSRKNEPLATDKLERKDIELLLVKHLPDETRATLFVPASAKAVYSDVVEKYRTRNSALSKTNAPLNRPLVEAIAEFRLAALKELWADDPDLFPADGTAFHWETWLRQGTVERFRSAAQKLGMAVGPGGLSFPETTVVRVTATPEQMAILIGESLCVAEVRATSVTAEFFDSLGAGQQYAFTQDLLDRLEYLDADESRSRVCLLDTGVNRGHALIAPACAEEDCNSIDPDWGNGDHQGHGTALAGVALFGDLTGPLTANQTIRVNHRLESMKIIPPTGENDHDLLGVITRNGVELAELFGDDAGRVFCLATTTEDDDGHFGRPTSWAAELDQLAAGVGDAEGPRRRLICVSTGNIREPNGAFPKADTYYVRNDAAEIEAPAQAWNAMTVGAFTNKVALTSPALQGYGVFAPAGDMSPNTRTASWESTWPVKPDFVLEGGNLVVDPHTNDGLTAGDVSILTTSRQFPNPVFDLTHDSSAATADAARLAATIMHEYPELWPETIRALLVASANWTPAMLAHLPEDPSKADFRTLLKRYGQGVPNLERACRSASNAVTLIVQDDLQPYTWEGANTALNEMKLYPLPWPHAALVAIPLAPVRLRICLSYFIEPNPSEAQRDRKLRYASHGLRFRVRLPDESDDEFRKRINKAALAPGEKVSKQDSEGWVLGSENREVGSIHCDTWSGLASDLANRSSIAVFPVGGWWKERPHLNCWSKRARFSMVVTIDAGDIDVDVYTPVSTAIEAQIPIPVG